MSQLNWKRQAVLAGVLFGLGTAAYWLEFRHRPKQEAEEEASKKAFQLKDEQVQAIRISDGVRTIAFACSDLAAKLCKPGDNSKWEITAPLKVKADEANVNGLLSTLNHLTPTDTIDLREETPEKRAALLKEYGLDPQSRNAPGARKVEVQIQGKEPATLTLGQPHPIGEGIFATFDENRVLVIPSHFKANLEHDLTYWRNKKLFTVAAHEISAFELEGGKAGKLKATRKDGQWSLDAGKETLVGDIENIDSLLSGATFLSAKTFVSDDKADAKARTALRGTRPALALSLWKTGTDTPITLRLLAAGSKQPPTRLFATLSNLDPLFELEPSSLDRLNKQLRELRLSKLITTMERFSAKRLEFSGKPLGAQPIVLANADGKWAFADKSEADAEKVQGTLDKLSGNRIKDFLQGAAIPRGQDEGITLSLSDDQGVKRRIAFWKAGGKLYARDLLSKRDEAFLVDTTTQDGLPWEAAFFRKTSAASPSPAKAP
ncbi:MAG: DUF4340 domain-containing protein [Oligoflexia bacterium]|nr:DUF4340 domain-containing protein [Oligoflexia bacterium]